MISHLTLNLTTKTLIVKASICSIKTDVNVYDITPKQMQKQYGGHTKQINAICLCLIYRLAYMP